MTTGSFRVSDIFYFNSLRPHDGGATTTLRNIMSKYNNANNMSKSSLRHNNANIMSKSSLLLLCLLVIISAAFSFTNAPPCITRRPRAAVSSVLMSEDDSAADESASSEPPKEEVKCPNCDLCDGSGRILGGIGVILPWWPIKAYRPCPNFINAGGKYQRSGQGLDEIAFGRDSSFNQD